jgi:hypothetical protein
VGYLTFGLFYISIPLQAIFVANAHLAEKLVLRKKGKSVKFRRGMIKPTVSEKIKLLKLL